MSLSVLHAVKSNENMYVLAPDTGDEGYSNCIGFHFVQHQQAETELVSMKWTEHDIYVTVHDDPGDCTRTDTQCTDLATVLLDDLVTFEITSRGIPGFIDPEIAPYVHLRFR